VPQSTPTSPRVREGLKPTTPPIGVVCELDTDVPFERVSLANGVIVKDPRVELGAPEPPATPIIAAKVLDATDKPAATEARRRKELIFLIR
jgi:hypothetical protein